MSWLTKKKQKLTRPTKTNGTVPDNLWLKDPETNAMVHRDELAENFFVFPSGAHMRIGPRTRFDQLFDNANYNLLPPPAVPEDPLQFVDLKKYTDRLAAARAVKDIGITNESTKVKSTPIAKNAAGQIIPEDALVAASGAIGGQPSVIACFNFYFMAGTMGQAVGEAFYRAAQYAIEQRAAFITITASGGARMQEGVFSLMQLPRTIIAVQRVREAKLPYIVILADPTTGGVTASIAMLGDVHIAERGALIGFAGRRVIEQTTRATLPKNFQTAEFLENHGVIDMVLTRKELKPNVEKLLRFLMPSK